MFNKDTLIAIGLDRGYHSRTDLCDALGKILGIQTASMSAKITNKTFTNEESEQIASFLEMTPKEFCDTFFHGLFIETPSGTYRAKEFLGAKPTRRQKKKEEKRKSYEDVLEFFENRG